MKTPITLIIMDGFGISDKVEGNAIKADGAKNITKLMSENPYTTLKASGLEVGLPEGQMGNSEVGHTNIGAGRIVYQELTRISKAIADGDFFTNEVLTNAIKKACLQGSDVHLMGLMSDGGVHSHDSHLYALLKACKNEGAKNVFVHCFMDGRDVAPTSGKGFLESLQNEIEKIGVGKIATVQGRYYAMDRDNRWERVEKAYNALTIGEGKKVQNAVFAVSQSYENGVTDEFIEPLICDDTAKIKPNDSVIFFNFRPDRAREITRCFVDSDFSGFERKTGFIKPHFVCFTQYDATMPNVEVAFKPQSLTNTLGEYISSLNMKQLRIAETEKYAHVTFFFNGGVEKVFEGEDRVLIPSPKVATYDLKPEMSAFEVCDAVCERVLSGKYDVIILNFANCDMVGHTGVFEAAKKAVNTVDACVSRVVDAVKQMGGISLITADHGNADQMLEDDLVSPFTAHTTNEVPFIVVGANVKLNKGRLCDISPTILDLLGLDKPESMTGTSLIIK